VIAHPQATHPPAPARVQVVAQEFRYSLSRTKVKAGHVIVELVNRGQDAHDLDLRRIGGKHVFRFPKVQPGEVVDRELKLRPGRYKLWCAIADHRERGMHAVLRVVRRKPPRKL
jgi:uncharacterized cupredoxin-like copper-binding protein